MTRSSIDNRQSEIGNKHMAKSKTFHCTVITPEGQVLDCEAGFAALPVHDGEMGILPNRAPLMCQLGIGVMRVEVEGKTERLFIDGGFAQMVKNRLSVLTEQAQKSGDIDPQAARESLKSARAMAGTSETQQAARRSAISRAAARIKTASS